MKNAFVCFLFAAIGCVASAQNERLYWANANQILSSELDGSGQTTIRSGITNLVIFAMPPGTDTFYYGVADAVFDNFSIYRGSPYQPIDQFLFEIQGYPVDMAFDTLNGHMFWTQEVGLAPQAEGLYRANLDGTERVLIDDTIRGGVDVDPQTGTLFAGQIDSKTEIPSQLVRMDLDGGNKTVLHTEFFGFSRILYNRSEDKLYITATGIDTYLLARMDRDGSNFEFPDYFDTNAFDFGPLGTTIYGARYHWTTFSNDLVSYTTANTNYQLLQSNPPIIVDIAVRGPNPVPTLSSWALIILILTMIALVVTQRHWRPSH